MEALISEEERPENVWKMGNNRYIYCDANRVVVNFERQCQPPPPPSTGTKIHVMPHLSYTLNKILEQKKLRTQFSGQNLTFL